MLLPELFDAEAVADVGQRVIVTILLGLLFLVIIEEGTGAGGGGGLWFLFVTGFEVVVVVVFVVGLERNIDEPLTQFDLETL